MMVFYISFLIYAEETLELELFSCGKPEMNSRIVKHDKVFDEQCRHGCSLSLSLNIHSVCP